MRMWNINPELLCRKHLMGEHVEMHSFLGCIKKSTSLKGYIENGLVEVQNIQKRHDELANEMIKRGYNHKSPLICCNVLWEEGCVDYLNNIEELKRRCPDCKKQIEERISYVR